MTWEQALQWAATGGVAAIAGLIISVLIEYWPAFQALQAKAMVAIYIILCLIIPMIAMSLGVVTGVGEWGSFGDTWWPAIQNGLGAASLGTLFHAWAPSPLRKA